MSALSYMQRRASGTYELRKRLPVAGGRDGGANGEHDGGVTYGVTLPLGAKRPGTDTSRLH